MLPQTSAPHDVCLQINMSQNAINAFVHWNSDLRHILCTPKYGKVHMHQPFEHVHTNNIWIKHDAAAPHIGRATSVA